MIKFSIALLLATSVSCTELETEGVVVGGWNVRSCTWHVGNENKECSPEEIEMVLLLRRDIQRQYGAQFNKFRIISMASQVVNGTNYWAKIETGRGYMHVKIHKPLKGEPEVLEVVDGQSRTSEFEYKPTSRISNKKKVVVPHVSYKRYGGYGSRGYSGNGYGSRGGYGHGSHSRGV